MTIRSVDWDEPRIKWYDPKMEPIKKSDLPNVRLFVPEVKPVAEDALRVLTSVLDGLYREIVIHSHSYGDKGRCVCGKPEKT